MKTRDEQELDAILKSSKADIARMLVNVQRLHVEESAALHAVITALKAEREGRDKVFAILERMAGEANFGLKVTR